MGAAEDPRVDRMAHVLVERMLAVQPGQSLLLTGNGIAAPLFRAVAARAAARGAQVTVSALPEGVEEATLAASTVAGLERDDPVALAIAGAIDARVRILAAWHPDELAAVPDELLAAQARGLRAAGELGFRRAASGAVRWAVCLHPCAAFAQEAGLGLEAYADLVYRAAFCDLDDPVAAWTRQGEAQARLRALLEAGQELRIRGPGTDLRLRIEGRTWRSSDAARNLPDGEVFTGPHERSAEGLVRFSYPGLRGGRRVEGISLRFEQGVVVEASAERHDATLQAALAIDEGARRLGEVGIGTNYRLDRWTANTLLDEKIGGTFHLALGRGYLETGSTNASAIHWDLVCDLRQGGEIELDGRPLQRDGRFLPELGLGLPFS